MEDEIILIEEEEEEIIELEDSEVLNLDYNYMTNKPKINDVELVGNKTLDDLGIQPKGEYLTSETDPVYSADKSSIALKSEIPTATSDLSNDSGFITSEAINTHNTSETSHLDIREAITNVEAIARGKSRARVFDTETELDAWLLVPENVADLEIGDNLYVEDTDTPDYWWNGTEKKPLEAEVVALVNYYTKTEVDTRLGLKIDKVTGTARVYVNDGSGNPNSIQYSSSAAQSTLMYRTTGGRSKIGTPVENDDIAHKGYVDNLLPYYQTKTTLDNPLQVGTIYNLGTLSANIAPTFPDSTNGKKIQINFGCDGTARTFIPSGTLATFSLTPLANTKYITEWEWINGEWVGLSISYVSS